VIRRHPVVVPEHGRRIGDPIAGAVAPGTRAVRGRLAGVSPRASLAAGAWVGFAFGLVLGALLGALLVWFAGSLLDWQRDLAFTFGIARRLLPFGDRVGLLREIEVSWWLVIPAVALGTALLAAFIGALIGGLLAAAYNRSPRHALVIVELPSDPDAGTVAVERAGEPAVDGAGARIAESPVLHSRPHGDDREEYGRQGPEASAGR
jgi:hypothetical protein